MAFEPEEYDRKIRQTFPYYEDFYKQITDILVVMEKKDVVWLDISKSRFPKTGNHFEKNFMADVFRIVDRFNITGRGIVYTVRLSKNAVLRIEDVLSDLNGNRFKVKGIEMLRRIADDIPFEKRPVGIMLEAMSGIIFCQDGTTIL